MALALGDVPPDDETVAKERKELEYQRQRADEFERSVCTTSLKEKDLAVIFGADWKTTWPRKIDLSSPKYQLEDLKIFQGSALRKNKITSIDVSENRLNDIHALTEQNGFGSVITLFARRNLVSYPTLKLPNLIELNLAHNFLRTLPDFSDVPLIETLILSHNKLRGTINHISGCRHLMRLDLAYNEYDFKPSELKHALGVLGNLSKLKNLRLKKNPFCEDFEQYEVFVVKSLKRLLELNDKKISRTTREKAEEYDLPPLEGYDQAVEQQKNKKQADKNRSGMGKAIEDVSSTQGYPRLQEIIEKLEEVLADPSKLHGTTQRKGNIDIVIDIAKRYAYAGNGNAASLTEDQAFWKNVVESDDDEEPYSAVVAHVLELFDSIMDRHDSCRTSVLECMAYLSAVETHEFGNEAMSRLGDIMESHESAKAEVFEALRTHVFPLLERFCRAGHMGGKKTKTIMQGLVFMMSDPDIRGKVAEGGKTLLPLFTEWFIGKNFSPQEDAHVIQMLACLTDLDANVEYICDLESGALSKKLATTCMEYLDNKSLMENTERREMWLGLLEIAGNLVRNSPEEHDLAEIFSKEMLHVRVKLRGESLFSDAADLLPPIEAKTLARSFTYLTEVMKRKEQVLKDLCYSYQLVEFLISVMKGQKQDALVLAATCLCSITVLGDKEIYAKHAKDVTDRLNNFTILLQYMGGNKYKTLHQTAIRHDDKPDDAEDDEPPRLGQQMNPIVHDAFIAILKTILFWLQDDSGEDAVREKVNHAMDRQDREKNMMKLLSVPNGDVKLQVMKALNKVPVNLISQEESSLLIQCLVEMAAKREGNAEVVLALVVTQLKQLVLDDGKAGRTFRNKFAEIAITEAFQILEDNTKRDTSMSENEDQEKMNLSLSIVSFFIACSTKSKLRGDLRNNDISDQFPRILKSEEEHCQPDSVDLPVEQTWTGRSIENLHACLYGATPLVRRMKIAIRVLSRIADVLQGRPPTELRQLPFKVGDETHYPLRGLSIHEICRNEAMMFDDRLICKSHHLLDDDEFADRNAEGIRFAEQNMTDDIQKFLTKIENTDSGTKYEDNLKQAEEIRNGMEDESDRLMQELMAEDEENKGMAEPKTVELDEGDDEEPAEAGSTILQQAIMRYEDVVGEDEKQLFTTRPAKFDCSSVWTRYKGMTHKDFHIKAADVDIENSGDIEGLKRKAERMGYCGFAVHGNDAVLRPSNRQIVPEDLEFADSGKQDVDFYIYEREAVFDDKKEGVMNDVFGLVAYLRMLYALVTNHPPAERCRVRTIKKLRTKKDLTQLLSLVDTIPCLSCNIAAKFLRLMSVALNSQVKYNAGKELTLEVYILVSTFVRDQADQMLHLLKLTKDRRLNTKETTLCVEMARFMMTMVRAVPELASKTPKLRVNRQCINYCVKRMVLPATIRLMIAMIIYDLQMDLGGGNRKRLPKDFAKQVYSKSGMKDYGTKLLVSLLVFCPEHTYSVLEVFNVAEVFMKASIRPCYLAELLHDVNLSNYLLFVEAFRMQTEIEKKLRKEDDQKPDKEKAIIFFEKVVDSTRSANLGRASSKSDTCILAVSRSGLMLLAPSAERPPFASKSMNSSTWDPSWETHGKKDQVGDLPPNRLPQVLWDRKCSDILKLYRCYGTQILVIAWKEELNAEHSKICFFGGSIRDELAETLRLHSGERANLRAKIESDPLIRKQVLGYMKMGEEVRVLCCTVAALVTDGAKPGSASSERRIFVLAMDRKNPNNAKVFAFVFNLEMWAPPKDESETAFELEDFLPSDLDSDREMKRDPETESRNLARHMRRTGVISDESRVQDDSTQALAIEDNSKAAKSSMLSLMPTPAVGGGLQGQSTPCIEKPKEYGFPPKEVMFHVDAEAMLTLKCSSGGELKMMFFDDSGREKWRKGLAYYLAYCQEKEWTREA